MKNNVILYKRPVAGGAHTLHLRYYINGKRYIKALNLRLSGDKRHDKFILETAEKIRTEEAYKLLSVANHADRVLSANNDFLKFFAAINDETPAYLRRVNIYKNIVQWHGSYNLPFNEISPQWWQRLKSWLITEKQHQLTTISTEFEVIKSILNIAVSRGMIHANPLASVREKRPRTVKSFLEAFEVEILHNTPCRNNELKRAFLFACFTGLRYSDIVSLTPAHIHRSQSGYQITVRMQKTGTQITVPIADQALVYLGDMDKIINSPQDMRLFRLPCKSGGNATLKLWILGAGIRKSVSFHTSRHTFATLALTYGADILSVRDLLGHSDIKTTMVYLKLVEEKKVQAIKNLPTFPNK